MTIQAYINFKGNCREAVEFYTEAFGSEQPVIMTFGDTPEDPNFPMSDEDKKLVMHSALHVADSTIMFSDCPPHMELTMGNNISLTLSIDDKEELTNWFNNLSVGGQVVMPLGPTFWSSHYGYVVDKFGIGWQISAPMDQE